MPSSSPLTERQKDFFHLMRRSTPVDGWYTVSSMLWRIVEPMPDDLIEKDHLNLRIRLTERGQAVMDYLV